jgi:hypothetical protein
VCRYYPQKVKESYWRGDVAVGWYKLYDRIPSLAGVSLVGACQRNLYLTFFTLCTFPPYELEPDIGDDSLLSFQSRVLNVLSAGRQDCGSVGEQCPFFDPSTLNLELESSIDCPAAAEAFPSFIHAPVNLAGSTHIHSPRHSFHYSRFVQFVPHSTAHCLHISKAKSQRHFTVCLYPPVAFRFDLS